MTSRERINASVAFRPVDRPPFDLIDEAGDLFSAGRYDPAMRLRLSYAEQVQARVAFHRKYRTDLIFDAPVLIPTRIRHRVRLTHEGKELSPGEPLLSSVSAMAWNAMPPRLIAPGLLPEAARGMVTKHIEWPGGRRSEEAIDLATGTTDVLRPLSRCAEDLLGNLGCLDGDLSRADYSHVRALRAAVGTDVMLSGTILDPLSAVGWYIGLQPLMYTLFDESAKAQVACEALTELAIRTGVDMVRHGLDMIRIGAATCCLLSPDLYRRFALPCQKELIRAIRSAGGIVHLHLCGNVKHLLDILPETGADILETITPPPLGDTTLREAKAAIGRRMCLKGNLSPTGALRNGTPEECLREARECLAVGSEGGGFIFSVADNLAPGTPEENVAAVAEILHG